MEEKNIDLYLWIEPKRDELYRLSNLDFDTANHYSHLWFEANDTHDYMLVLSGSTPWSEPKPSIIDISAEWIFEQINLVTLVEDENEGA